MEAFFSGTVILLYLISYYAAEIIFVVACFLPALFGAGVLFFFRLGGCGRIIAAKKRLKRMAKAGAISGDKRGLLYKRCVKHTPPGFRAAYALFLEEKITASELSLVGVQSISLRRGAVRGASVGIGLLASLLVFLTFYFAVPIAETFLRTAVCAFHATISGMVLRFALCGYTLAGERAAHTFADLLDSSLLRNKKEACLQEQGSPLRPSQEGGFSPSEEDRAEVNSLRALLRELDKGALGNE